MSAGEALNFDMALQKESVFRKSKRLIVFDVDSTLIDMEIIDEDCQGSWSRERALSYNEDTNRGIVDFQQSVTAESLQC